MSDPNSAREDKFIVQDNKNALNGKIRLLLTVVIIAMAAGGFALYHQIGAVDNKMSSVQTSLADLRRSVEDLKARNDRTNVVIGGTATAVTGVLREQARIGELLARIESSAAKNTAPSQPSPFALNPSQMTAIREAFNLMRKNGEQPTFHLGDKVPAADLKPMPDELLQKAAAPQLKGTKFLIDKNGALVVTASADNLVVLIVEPA